ncbi:uncharacterized protein [Vulpes vulpes]|uniref:Uncharacterized protein n=1 Tax=Vulpes vulpes TaxID=9627 RepID=A0ABM4YCM7_VULVU
MAGPVLHRKPPAPAKAGIVVGSLNCLWRLYPARAARATHAVPQGLLASDSERLRPAGWGQAQALGTCPAPCPQATRDTRLGPGAHGSGCESWRRAETPDWSEKNSSRLQVLPTSDQPPIEIFRAILPPLLPRAAPEQLPSERSPYCPPATSSWIARILPPTWRPWPAARTPAPAGLLPSSAWASTSTSTLWLCTPRLLPPRAGRGPAPGRREPSGAKLDPRPRLPAGRAEASRDRPCKPLNPGENQKQALVALQAPGGARVDSGPAGEPRGAGEAPREDGAHLPELGGLGFPLPGAPSAADRQPPEPWRGPSAPPPGSGGFCVSLFLQPLGSLLALAQAVNQVETVQLFAGKKKYFSGSSWCIKTQVIWGSLILYPATLLDSFISYNSFFVCGIFRVFSI